MKISGVKVIQLTAEEKTILTTAGHLLDDLAEQIGSIGADDDLVSRLSDCYELCLDVVREEKFEYVLDGWE